MKQISQNIRRLRKEKGMSQEQLAQALHVTRADGIRLGAGNSPTRSGRSGADCPITGVEPERLLYGEDSGRGRFYRGVSFWPVLGVTPCFMLWYSGFCHPHKPGSRHFY